MPPATLSELIRLVEDGTISGKIGKEIFEESYKTGEAPRAIVERRGVQQISDEAALWEIVDRVVGANPKQAEDYAERQGRPVRVLRRPGDEGDAGPREPGDR